MACVRSGRDAGADAERCGAQWHRMTPRPVAQPLLCQPGSLPLSSGSRHRDGSWGTGFSAKSQALAGAILTGILLGHSDAGAIEFELPVACAMGKVCSIQKYVDHDPGPERVDYACGRMSLDGDQGTDFRVPDFVTMDRGVAVIAAAPGVVKSVRDGMADVSVREIGQAALGGRLAGNGVVIDHGEGWETQYSHLRQGSVAVKPGDRLDTGQRLGLFGLSGNTE